MKIVIVSDAWLPQTNGVVTTLRQTRSELQAMGHDVQMITPDAFRSVPCPGYREIRLALWPGRRVGRLLAAARPDAIHIATEGPLGMAARRWCVRRGVPFATSFHTRFPEYLRLRAPVPTGVTYAWLRRFHRPAERTLVRSPSQRRELAGRGFDGLVLWPGGVDPDLFRPRGKAALALPRPVSMYMGRVAVEKGLDDFLGLDLPGSRVVIGDGPDLEKLRSRYPGVHFLGRKTGEDLARHLSAADVFVFPSRTDTLGLVMLEAMACGVPVAAFPVPGPADVVVNNVTGALDEDLGAAVFRALSLDGDACIEFAREHGWRRATERFLSCQTRIAWPGDAGAAQEAETSGPPEGPSIFRVAASAQASSFAMTSSGRIRSITPSSSMRVPQRSDSGSEPR